jgi:hypothetical protein
MHLGAGARLCTILQANSLENALNAKVAEYPSTHSGEECRMTSECPGKDVSTMEVPSRWLP